jgi:Ca2+-binding EF-hand superfamily protein
LPYQENFDLLDADGNGRLTEEEFSAWPHPHREAEVSFERRDSDGDGIITREEFCPDSW